MFIFHSAQNRTHNQPNTDAAAAATAAAVAAADVARAALAATPMRIAHGTRQQRTPHTKSRTRARNTPQ